MTEISSEVKGVWLVTAKGYVLERRGADILERIASHVDEPLRAGVTAPLPSAWYPERVLQQAVHGMRMELANDDDQEFLRVMQECTEVGVSRFFRTLLRLSTPEFVLRQVPTMWRQIRRGAGRVRVETTATGMIVKYSEFPWFADRNYRLLTLGSLTALLRLCTRRPPDIAIAERGPDWLNVVIRTNR